MNHASLVEAFYHSYNAHDVEAIVALYAPDGTHEDVAFKNARTGHEALRAGLAGFFSMFVDVHFAEGRRIWSGQSAVLPYQLTATATRNIGPMQLAGRSISLSGAHVLDFSDAGIKRSLDYWDPDELRRCATASNE